MARQYSSSSSTLVELPEAPLAPGSPSQVPNREISRTRTLWSDNAVREWRLPLKPGAREGEPYPTPPHVKSGRWGLQSQRRSRRANAVVKRERPWFGRRNHLASQGPHLPLHWTPNPPPPIPPSSPGPCRWVTMWGMAGANGAKAWLVHQAPPRWCTPVKHSPYPLPSSLPGVGGAIFAKRNLKENAITK